MFECQCRAVYTSAGPRDIYLELHPKQSWLQPQGPLTALAIPTGIVGAVENHCCSSQPAALTTSFSDWLPSFSLFMSAGFQVGDFPVGPKLSMQNYICRVFMRRARFWRLSSPCPELPLRATWRQVVAS